MVWKNSSWLTSFFISDGICFHPSLLKTGLYATADAPIAFSEWMRCVLRDWSFENVVTAHNSDIIGTAHHDVTQLIDKFQPYLERLAKHNAKRQSNL